MKLKLRPQWNEAMRYLKESSPYLITTVVLFAFSVSIGFLYPDLFSERINEMIRDLVLRTENLKGLELIFYILQNNALTAFMGLIFGIGLGIFSIMSTMVNGVVIGYVMGKVYEIAGPSQFWRLLPHGIFELPAIFISLALGLKLGMFVFAKHKGKELKRRFYESMNVFLVVVLPLLIIAAIIEGTLITLF
ncbi:stage II sporulation protein M [Candidatus Pacearchaeota archaeon]|nr:stage II sporulation protein M [Candidatus Pacearchaeota archaeon]